MGPTASGKSAAAIQLAQKIKGEIVSADSRQIYKYLNVGSGKITKKEMSGIKHHCLDIVNPKLISTNFQNYSVYDYLAQAEIAIQKILQKNKIPIICGGTGLYIDAILYGLPKNSGPNSLLRKNLEDSSLEKILEIIKKLNLEKYLDLVQNKNPSERNNKRRLIRIVEILESKKQAENQRQKNEGMGGKIEGKIEKKIELEKLNTKIKYNAKFIFLPLKAGPPLAENLEKEKLRKRINLRLKKRLEAKGKNNLISEVKFLIEDLKVDTEWLISLGLEYKYVTLYLQNKISKEQMILELQNKIWQYAKRQILWNKRYLKKNI